MSAMQVSFLPKWSRLRWTIVLVIALLANVWLYTKIFWPSTVTDAPEVLANLYAKELCTCRFVVGQTLERCYEQHENIMRPSTVDFDEAEQSVRVRVLWAQSSARVVSPRFGCLRD